MIDGIEKNATEIIARRKDGIIWMYVFTLVISLIAIIFPGFLIGGKKGSSITGVFLIVIGVICLIISVVVLIGIIRTPADIITRKDEFLCFPDGSSCNLSEIKQVNYRRASARGLQYKWGKIIIVLNDRTIIYNYVADVVQVHNRLIELMLKSKENNQG